MAAYVITSWRAQPEPDGDDEYVQITGRKQGFISWVLSLVKVSPAVSVKVSGTRVEFSEGSLLGSVHRVIPLQGLCSTIHGYVNPWMGAALLFVLLAILVVVYVGDLAGLAGTDSGFKVAIEVLVGLLVDFFLVAIYFMYDRKLTLGFVENSGAVSAVQFRRSKVEDQDIGEAQAVYVCELVQMAADARLRSLLSPPA